MLIYPDLYMNYIKFRKLMKTFDCYTAVFFSLTPSRCCEDVMESTTVNGTTLRWSLAWPSSSRLWL